MIHNSGMRPDSELDMGTFGLVEAFSTTELTPLKS